MTRPEQKNVKVDKNTKSASVTRLRLKVVPGASCSEIAGWLGDVLKIRVAEAPEKGKANKAVETIISDVLALPARAVKITKGQRSANKTLEVTGLSLAEIQQRLAVG